MGIRMTINDTWAVTADELASQLPNSKFADELKSLRAEAKRLKSCTDSVGADGPSEDDLIAEGVRFGDWEKGFNAAVEIIERRLFGVGLAKKRK